jgi:hypothetical protein
MRTALVSITAFVLFLLLLELLFRAVVYVDKGAVEQRFLVRPHPTLGWVLNTQMETKRMRNRCGEVVEMEPVPHRFILKSASDHGDKISILFLGDSYTHAHEVSTGKAYYDVFEDLEKDNYAVYAVGVGGYGNLQEYLALEMVYPEIRPDVVVWQLGGNDVSNNVYELDNDSIRNNQRPRPYLDPQNGEVIMRNPGNWLFDWSQGFGYLFKKLLILDSRYELGLLDWLDSITGVDAEIRPGLSETGLAVLDYVVLKAASRYPDTTFIGFSVDQKYDEEYWKIFNRHGALYLPLFYKALDARRKTDCKPLDSHWNHLGNQVAGLALRERIGQVLANR